MPAGLWLVRVATEREVPFPRSAETVLAERGTIGGLFSMLRGGVGRLALEQESRSSHRHRQGRCRIYWLAMIQSALILSSSDDRKGSQGYLYLTLCPSFVIQWGWTPSHLCETHFLLKLCFRTLIIGEVASGQKGSHGIVNQELSRESAHSGYPNPLGVGSRVKSGLSYCRRDGDKDCRTQ